MRYLILLAALLAGPCLAVIETHEFETEAQRLRYQNFVEELRCPKCQNQNIADSDAPIAKDLRRELSRMLNDDYSDQEILDYMVSRYGNFVLYDPPVDSKTLILWIAPVAFVLLGGIVVLLLVVRQKRNKQEAKDQQLSSEERDRLERLLAEDDN